MRVVIVSKAFTAATYRKKLDEIAKLGVEVVAVVPPVWREGGAEQRLEASEHAGYTLIPSPIRLNGHFHLHYYPQLPRIIREARPDIVHLDEEPYNLATYLGVRAAKDRPSLFFTWQNIARRYPPPFSWLERSVYGKVNGAIAGSQEAKQVLVDKGFAKPAWVIPQFGVDPDVFSPAGSESSRPFTVGFLNRLIPAKAPLQTLKAFEKLPADARLRYVGDGPLKGTLQSEIQSRGLSDRVTIDGRLPSADVPRLMKELDVVVLPSLTTPRWKEQFGRVLIEAMASGVPVVGSSSGEIPTVIGDGGLVVPEGDIQALADALNRLHDDRRLRETLARRGRERVLRHFTHARVAEETVGAYKTLLANSMMGSV